MSHTSQQNHVRIPDDDRYDLCDHVQPGDTAYKLYCEDDSFGPVYRYACCESCATTIDEQEQEEPVFCRDCHQTYPRKDTIEWLPFDFDPRDGSEPLIICDTCVKADRHTKRVQSDQHYHEQQCMWYDE